MSDAFELNGVQIDTFSFSVQRDGQQIQDEGFDVCLLDQTVEVFNLDNDDSLHDIVWVLVDESDTIIAQFETDTTSFTQIPPGNYKLFAIKYSAVLEDLTGELINYVYYHIDGCSLVSNNYYNVNILGEGSGCDVAVNNVFGYLFSISSNIITHTVFVQLDDATSLPSGLKYNLVNSDGAIIKVGEIKDSVTEVRVSDLTEGLYFLQLSSASYRQNFKFVKY